MADDQSGQVKDPDGDRDSGYALRDSVSMSMIID